MRLRPHDISNFSESFVNIADEDHDDAAKIVDKLLEQAGEYKDFLEKILIDFAILHDKSKRPWNSYYLANICDHRLSADAKVIFLYLTYRQGRRESIYESRETIAHRTGLTLDRVKKGFKQLTHYGFLKSETKTIDGVRRTYRAVVNAAHFYGAENPKIIDQDEIGKYIKYGADDSELLSLSRIDPEFAIKTAPRDDPASNEREDRKKRYFTSKNKAQNYS